MQYQVVLLILDDDGNEVGNLVSARADSPEAAAEEVLEQHEQRGNQIDLRETSADVGESRGHSDEQRRATLKIGDTVALESQRTGQPAQTGVVQAIHGRLIDVRWDDGRETSFIPAAGSLHVVE
jgi:hypothetical protein